MKHLTRLVLILMFGAIVLSCKNDKSETAETPEATEAGESTSEVEEVVTEEVSIDATIYNANLVTEMQLESMKLPSVLIMNIIQQRPFLNMAEFEAVIPESVDKAELYKSIFVPLNLNTTAEDDFKIIPGVGKRMAHEFEEYRPYTSIKQFRKEIGKYVDEAEVARYENYVFVPVELNSASEEDILALPGVGKRMAHEFEEYRPYKNMAQFRKEIGKYVDDNELSRLERFVYIKE